MEILGGDGASPASGPGAGANVKDSTDQTFMVDVIEASRETPVLVDFWAPWCGPCKTLGPMIENAVNARGGAVKLVKINIDENPGIAGQLGVRSIPAVFAFHNGQPVDGFMGAVPESQIHQFIDKIMSGTDDGKAIIEALEQADTALAAGDTGGAAQIFAAIINAQPDNVPAIAGLARCYLANGDVERARETLLMAPEDKRDDPLWVSADKAVGLMSNAPAPEEAAAVSAQVEAVPADNNARFALAEKLIASGQNGPAVDHLLDILTDDLDWEDGKAKSLLLEVFEAAGPKDPATISGRRRLSSLMFA